MGILIEVLNCIGLASLVWMFVKGAEPVQFLKRYYDIDSETKTKNVWLIAVSKFINCCKCIGFWVGLVCYQDILYACAFAIFAELFDVIISKQMLK